MREMSCNKPSTCLYRYLLYFIESNMCFRFSIKLLLQWCHEQMQYWINMRCRFLQKKCISVKEIIKHTKLHIRQKVTIMWPFRGCQKKYNKVSSFSSHISRCHDADTAVQSTQLLCSITDVDDDNETTPVSENHQINTQSMISVQSQSSQMKHKLALFYFML